MKRLRWFIAGIVWGVFSYVVHGVVNGGIFKNWYKGHEYLYRTFDSAMMIRLFILNIIMGLVVSLLYSVLYKGIPGKSIVGKGFLFGILFFLPRLVGLFFQYTLNLGPFPFPCLISEIIAIPLGGILIALIYGKEIK